MPKIARRARSMEIPKPNEYAKTHGHNPFPPRWEKWLSAVRHGILSAQPKAGRHVTIDEHPGKGTVINVDRRAAPPTGECFNISFSATVSGNAFMIGEGCCVSVPVEGSNSATGAFCCDSGDPVPCPTCASCIFISPALGEVTYGDCGGLCQGVGAGFNTYIELDFDGINYTLKVLGSVAANFGNPPDCSGVCTITSDSENTYSLGSVPTGTHTFDFTGDNTGATYHFVITIT
jgi:hypothetical protein